MRYLVPVLALCLLTTPLSADQVISDDLIVTRSLCVGSSSCADGETFSGEDIKLRSSNPEILFSDSSLGAGNLWRLQGDSDVVANDSFALTNDSTGFTPLTINKDAPNNAFVIQGNGEIGLGTIFPRANIHIVDSGAPQIRLEAAFGDMPEWMMQVGSDGLSFFDMKGGPSLPLVISNGAPTSSINVRENGNVGIGTGSPSAALHVSRRDGTASILVQNRFDSPSAVREMFAMRNNGGSYFTLDNTSADTTWFFVHENASPNRFIITDGVNDGPEMTLTADGDLTIEGNFFASSGTKLNVPDYVFADDYALRPLAEVARFIKKNSHLPDVPSAAEIADGGLNMTQMQMALLRKVEELTLYTIGLEDEARAQRDTIARQAAHQIEAKADMAEMMARVERLEAALAAR